MPTPHPSPTPAPVIPSRIRYAAFVLRQASQNEADPENAFTYKDAANDAEKEADKVEALAARVAESEEYIKWCNSRIRELDAENASLREALLEVATDFEAVCVQEGRETFASAKNARRLLGGVS